MNDTMFHWIAEVLGKGMAWLGVCLVMSTGGWLAWGFWLAARWRREAVAIDDPECVETLRLEATALGSARIPGHAVHPTAPAPCLVGVGRRATIRRCGEPLKWELR